MTFTYRGFSFTLTLDSSGLVTGVATPQIGPVGPQTATYESAKTVPEVEATLKAYVDAILALLGG